MRQRGPRPVLPVDWRAGCHTICFINRELKGLYEQRAVSLADTDTDSDTAESNRVMLLTLASG